jgi:hypothetical protein
MVQAIGIDGGYEADASLIVMVGNAVRMAVVIHVVNVSEALRVTMANV